MSLAVDFPARTCYNFGMKFAIKELGDTIKVTGLVNVHFFEFEKDFHTERDRHPFYELVYVSRGTLDIASEDYTGRLKKGEFIVHRPDEYHSFFCSKGDTPIVIIIGFTCEGQSIDFLSRAPIALRDAEVKKLAEIVKEGRSLFRPPYDVPMYDMKKKDNVPLGTEQLLKNLLEYFLITVLRRFSLAESDPSEKTARADNLSIGEIVGYIDSNFCQKILIDELAFIFCTNRSTLCSEFKRQTGQTIARYINEKKVAFAKERLLSTDKSVSDIADELGFESIYYFTRFFKNLTGETPSGFRKAAGV